MPCRFLGARAATSRPAAATGPEPTALFSSAPFKNQGLLKKGKQGAQVGDSDAVHLAFAQQDAAAGRLSEKLTTLHGIAVGIGSELHAQGKILDETSRDLDHANDRVQGATSRVSTLLRSMSDSRCCGGLIGCEHVVIAVLLVMLLATVVVIFTST